MFVPYLVFLRHSVHQNERTTKSREETGRIRGHQASAQLRGLFPRKTFAGGTSDESLRSPAGSEEGRVDTRQGVDRGCRALSAERTTGPERGEKDGSAGSRQSRWPSIALRAPARKGCDGSARLKPPAQNPSCAGERLAARWQQHSLARGIRAPREAATHFFFALGAPSAVLRFELVDRNVLGVLSRTPCHEFSWKASVCAER
ncbi:hypothetical protein MTO96_015196 [Rhipicephalus appendiculatus]